MGAALRCRLAGGLLRLYCPDDQLEAGGPAGSVLAR
jgi:hypothetical protein